MKDESRLSPSPGPRTRKARCRLILAAFCVLTFPGCAYLRSGEKSLGELKKTQQEQKEINQSIFKPGTIFYSR